MLRNAATSSTLGSLENVSRGRDDAEATRPTDRPIRYCLLYLSAKELPPIGYGYVD